MNYASPSPFSSVLIILPTASEVKKILKKHVDSRRVSILPGVPGMQERLPLRWGSPAQFWELQLG